MRHLRRLLHPTHLWDLFVASDPDLGRLRQGLRAVTSAILAALILSQLARRLGEPATVPMIGIMVAMMGSQLATDPGLRAQRITTLLMVLPATVSVVLGTLAARSPWLGGVAFTVTVFAATFVRRFGPRGLALGMIGFMSLFVSLFFHAELAQVPALIGAVWVAIGIAYTVRFGLIRERPERHLRRFLRTFHKTVSLVLWNLADVPEQPRWTPALERRLRHEADRLNDAALAVEDLLNRDHPDLRLRIFDLELAAERVIGAVEQVVQSGALPPSARQEVRGALLAAHAAVRDGEPSARQTMRGHIDRVRACVLSAPDPERGHADMRRLCVSISDLVDAAEHLPSEVPPPAPETQAVPPKASPSPREETAENGLHPATRQALQVTVASVLAMAAGYAVSSARWYWAAITAFVIFTRTKTLGDTLLRAWYRVLGTLLGVLAGLLLARGVSGHRVIELLTIFTCVFFSFYLIRVSYAWMVFWFTTLLSVLYSLLGRFTPGLLYLRLEETVIGASLGAATAILLLPERTTVHIRSAMSHVLSSVCEYLEQAVVKRSRDADPARVLDAARDLDASLRELRAAARPLTRRLVRLAPRTSRTVHTVSALVLFARNLVPGKGFLEGHETARELIREAGARLANNARALARAQDSQEAPVLTPAAGLIEQARRSLQGDEAIPRGPASPATMLRWLARVDDALTLLAETSAPRPRSA